MDNAHKLFQDFPFFPDVASSFGNRVDNLYLLLVGVSVFFSILIMALIIFFVIRYRVGRPGGPKMDTGHIETLPFELTWTLIPLAIAIVIYWQSAGVYFQLRTPPANASDIYVVGKQWMWKIQHPDGKREINELHVPIGKPVRLIMTSQDVIHSFYVPAFRTKQDVVPGRYAELWFTPTKPGRYHLFCAEYCGTQHSGMIGWVTAMKPEDYQNWLSGAAGGGSLASQGEALVGRLGCLTCHRNDAAARAPHWEGLFGSRVQLKDGRTVTANEGYIRESILDPTAKVVAGFEPIMPTYKSQVSEEEIMQIIAYIKSLKGASGMGAAATGPANPQKVQTPAHRVNR